MSDIDKAGLRAAAEGATPGPWITDGTQVAQGYLQGAIYGGILHASWESSGEANARYVAAANPAVVLDLLDELNELRAVRDRVARVQSRLRAPDKTLVSRVLQLTYELIADLLDGKTEETP